jgi:hypothetical protein
MKYFGRQIQICGDFFTLYWVCALVHSGKGKCCDALIPIIEVTVPPQGKKVSQLASEKKATVVSNMYNMYIKYKSYDYFLLPQL